MHRVSLLDSVAGGSPELVGKGVVGKHAVDGALQRIRILGRNEDRTLLCLHVLVKDRSVGDDDWLRHGHRFQQRRQAAAFGAVGVVRSPDRQDHTTSAVIEVAELAEREASPDLDVRRQVETADVAILADDYELGREPGGRLRERPIVAGKVLAYREDEPTL